MIRRAGGPPDRGAEGKAGTGSRRTGVPRPARGFSLIELMLVVAVTLVLTALLLPALGHLRENAHRVICGSNLRQVGYATTMFADEHGCLPPSVYGEQGGNKPEMMQVHRGSYSANWEGLGWLYYWRYCQAPEVFYCPSHIGEHPYEAYRDLYLQYRYSRANGSVAKAIYANYHYAGHKNWETGTKRSLAKDPLLVIATDGLRTLSDFNHRTGLNILRGDTSVFWREDADTRRVAAFLPSSAKDGTDLEEYTKNVWELIIQSESEPGSN